MNETIVVGMGVKNNKDTLELAVRSFLDQINVKRKTLLVIAFDNTNDGSKELIQQFLPEKRIRIINVDNGKCYATRNDINDYIRNNVSDCCLIGRLDADDLLIDNESLCRVERIYEHTAFDVLIMGNKQKQNGKVLNWINKADQRFLDDDFLLERLKQMVEGNNHSELPSCNTFIRPAITIKYPETPSAEDHWFTVLLLMQKEKLKIHIAEDVLYSIYSLDGNTTTNNRKSKDYYKARLGLMEFFKSNSTRLL